ncbi:MAG: hypothetical protein CME71_11985 [Halobacteriovorax sp.]|nr:hypothetical protein [Halobacteriovorax sp.]
MLNLFKSADKKWNSIKNMCQTPSAWHVLDYNRHQFKGRTNVLHLERHNIQSSAEVINFFPSNREIDFNFGFTNAGSFTLDKQLWTNEVIETLERHIATQIQNFTQTLKSAPPIQGDIVQETKGQEWLKTSLVVLERALENLKADQTLQLSLFAGEKDSKQEFRFIIFNLDLAFRYDSKKCIMTVTCFNKKDQDQFDYSKPDFEGAFASLAYPVFDQAINLSLKISSALIKEISR